MQEFIGQWWLPGQQEQRVGGTLKFKAGRGGTLELTAPLMDPDSDIDLERVVLGVVQNGQPVTVVSATRVSMSGIGDPPQTHFESWICHMILIGRHFPEGDGALFTQARLVTGNLKKWVRASHPVTHFGRDTFNVNLQIPAEKVAQLPGGRLGMEWRPLGTSSDQRIEFDISRAFTWQSAAPAVFDELWEDFVTPIVYFLTFATDSPDHVAGLRLWKGQTGRVETTAADALLSVWSGSDKLGSETIPPHYLLRDRDVLPRFEAVFKSWFDVYHRYKGPLLQFFSPVLTGGMSMEEVFLREVRAIESWHYIDVANTPRATDLATDHLTALMRRVKGAVRDEEWPWVAALLSPNRPPLQRRLDEVLEEAGDPVLPLVGRYQSFTQRVKQTRNALTHGVGDWKFTHNEMHWAEMTLRTLFNCVLLRRLGYNGDVPTLVGRTRRWAALSSPNNVLASSS